MLRRGPPEELMRRAPAREALDDGLGGGWDEVAAEGVEFLRVAEAGQLGE